MGPRQSRFLLVGLALLLGGPLAFAGDYSDPSGFSFAYPDGWVPVTHTMMADVQHPLPDEMKAWITRNNVDLNHIAVVLIHDKHDEFLESVNVVVQGQEIPLEDDTVAKLTNTITQHYKEIGMAVEGVQGRLQRVGSRDAVVLEYTAHTAGGRHILRQKQVMFSGGGKTFIVTCTAMAISYRDYQPAFERVLESFQVPNPVKRGFDWKQTLMMGLMGAAAGATITGGYRLIKWLSTKASPPEPMNVRKLDKGGLPRAKTDDLPKDGKEEPQPLPDSES